MVIGMMKENSPPMNAWINEQLEGAHESVYLRQALAFNAEKYRGSRDPGHAPFWKNFGGHVRSVPGNMCVKFEVRSFNRFWANSI